VGRPSIAEERVAQILEATGRAIARYGVEGATLERVAAEAGLSRSLVRYFVGNRDDLIELYRQRLLDRYSALPVQAVDGVPATQLLLEALFDEQPDLDDYAAIDAILAATRHDDDLRDDVLSFYRGMEAAIAAAVRHDHPDWGEQRVTDVAYQVLTAVYGHWTMHSLGFPSDRAQAAREQARKALAIPRRGRRRSPH
jgi:AcrR family transcriptional regulator